MAAKKASIPNLLLALAKAYRDEMINIGGDPGDPSEVESFIGGCAVAKKVKAIILNELDDD